MSKRGNPANQQQGKSNYFQQSFLSVRDEDVRSEKKEIRVDQVDCEKDCLQIGGDSRDQSNEISKDLTERERRD